MLPLTNRHQGISVWNAGDTEITQNVIFDNADRGIQLFPNAQRTHVAYNTIDGNGEGAPARRQRLARRLERQRRRAQPDHELDQPRQPRGVLARGRAGRHGNVFRDNCVSGGARDNGDGGDPAAHGRRHGERKPRRGPELRRPDRQELHARRRAARAWRRSAGRSGARSATTASGTSRPRRRARSTPATRTRASSRATSASSRSRASRARERHRVREADLLREGRAIPVATVTDATELGRRATSARTAGRSRCRPA